MCLSNNLFQYSLLVWRYIINSSTYITERHMVDLNKKKFDVKLCQTQRRNLVIKQLEQPKAFFFLIQNEYYSDKRKEFFFFLHLLPTYFKRKYGEIHYILLYIIYGIRWTRRVNAEYDDACWWYEKKFGKKNSRWGSQEGTIHTFIIEQKCNIKYETSSMILMSDDICALSFFASETLASCP